MAMFVGVNQGRQFIFYEGFQLMLGTETNVTFHTVSVSPSSWLYATLFALNFVPMCVFFSGVGLSPLGLLYKPQMIGEGDCGAIGRMKIGRGNRSTRRKPAPVPLCQPQIPHDQTRARTPGRRGGKPATNRLSYDAASFRTDNQLKVR
jgi:hypothetical protein